MAGPNGEILPIPVAALSGSPFANYFVPGAILFTILGIGPLGAAVLAWRRHPVAPMLTFAVGGALLIWLIVEIVIVGYSNDPPLQAWYLGLGVVISLVGVGWMRRVGWPRKVPRITSNESARRLVCVGPLRYRRGVCCHARSRVCLCGVRQAPSIPSWR